MSCQGIIPPYLLSQIAAAGESYPNAAAAAQTALAERPLRTSAPAPTPDRTATATPAGGLARTIHDAANGTTLPGRLVRSEGDAAVADVAVDEAYDGLGDTYAMYDEVYGRNSVDGEGLPLVATVHYGTKYDNAYWNGSQMVFGDGDGEVFGRFTASVSVIGHELTHGVTQYTADLTYDGQSGALNESISDVFGVLVEQYTKKQSAAEASWLVGEGLFTSAVQGKALRSMSAPGTAYDDDVLGKDPQPADMSGYVSTTEDNGGVHLNSGIPNRAFYLAATAIGGNAWEVAGKIWYDTLTGGLPASANFATFARATIAAAQTYGGSAVDAVTSAWRTVGVLTQE